MIIKTIRHLGRKWKIVFIEGSYFARQGLSDTGPYSTVAEAEVFITQVKS